MSNKQRILEQYARDIAQNFAERGYTQEQAEDAFVAGAQWIQTYVNLEEDDDEQQSDENDASSEGVCG